MIHFIVLTVISTIYQVLINVNIVRCSNNEKCCQHSSLTVTLIPVPTSPMELPHEGTVEVTLGSKRMPGILFPRQASSPALKFPEGVSVKLLPASVALVHRTCPGLESCPVCFPQQYSTPTPIPSMVFKSRVNGLCHLHLLFSSLEHLQTSKAG